MNRCELFIVLNKTLSEFELCSPIVAYTVFRGVVRKSEPCEDNKRVRVQIIENNRRKNVLPRSRLVQRGRRLVAGEFSPDQTLWITS